MSEENSISGSDGAFTEDDASEYCRKMWLALAHGFSDDAALMAGDPYEAVRMAVFADACYWQAAGITECPSLKEILEAGNA